jgi:23S rRNA-/tRNA-specific pseudouridylate synthase
MAKMGNRERIARAAEEARLTAAEKATKKAAKPTASVRAKRVATPTRMKIVWDVCGTTGAKVKSFPYAEKAAAEIAAAALTRSTGRTHQLRPTKVPMD